MLHAFSHKKSRLYRRYLGHRDDPTERRVAEEDEITSLIMGPLAFLSPASIGSFWLSVIQLRNPHLEFPLGSPSYAEMQFWPRRENIEPDLRVELSWGNDTRIILVEFKWHSPLSGENQLHDQWQKYLQPHEQPRALHLFIGLDTSAGVNALSRDDVWKGKFVMRSWFDVLTSMESLRSGSGIELRRWSEQVCTCLTLLGVKKFSGFEKLKFSEKVDFSTPVFFRGINSIYPADQYPEAVI